MKRGISQAIQGLTVNSFPDAHESASCGPVELYWPAAYERTSALRSPQPGWVKEGNPPFL